MRGLQLTITTTLMCGLAAAQTAAEALLDLGAPAAAPDGAPTNSAAIDRDGLRAHAYWLADDARGGRHTASKGQRDTADYVAAHF